MTNIKTNFTIYIYQSWIITYLDEIVFKPFLVCDSNKIDLHDNEFLGLENDKNRWLGIYKEKKVLYNWYFIGLS